MLFSILLNGSLVNTFDGHSLVTLNISKVCGGRDMAGAERVRLVISKVIDARVCCVDSQPYRSDQMD